MFIKQTIILLTLTVCVWVSSYSQVNLTQGLMAYYPFNGNANDISGNNNNPIFNNATLTADRNGNANNAYHFNGIDNYMQIPNAPSLNMGNTLSICAWFNVTGFFQGNCHGNVILSKGDNTTANGNFVILFDDNYITNSNNCSIPTPDTIHQTIHAKYVADTTPKYIIKNKWTFVCMTYDGVNARLFINCQLVGVRNIPNQVFNTVDDLFFGKLNGNTTSTYWLNGDLDDVRIYNRAINDDEVKALNDFAKPDFSFTQNICNPKQITFNNQTSNTVSLSWNFGNNTTDNSNNNPVVNYAAYNNYNVKLVVTNSNGCRDSITKSVAVNVTLDTSLIINKDTSICLGATFKINVKDTGMAYCWSASSGSVISNATSQTITPTTNTVYYFNSKTTGNNLVVNGDFEAGNIGFTSEHSYKTPPRTSQSQYYIGTNPNVWFNPFVACKDHTSNGGNMMMFDGSATANTAMWKQTIPIQPNTDYLFSGWVQSIVAQDPAQIILKINGNKVGATTTANLSACSWKQVSAIWNSGNNTIANLTILDSNIAIQGNDFAIDDISFAPVNIKTDSVRVDVTNCSLNNVCKGVIELHGHDRVIPPQSNFKKYFPASGFTWETWFNGSYFDNTNTTLDTRSKLIAATDIPYNAQDIVLGFGWVQVAQKRELCFVADGPNQFADRDNTPCTYFPTGGFIPNTWYHVAAVRDYANNTSKLYVNGILVDSKTNTHQPLNPNSNFLVPNFYFGSMTGIGSTDSGFAGKMDEIRIWNTPRTATEIQTNYNKCLTGSETGLVAYYHSNEKTGTILHDVSPNVNSASLSTTVTLNKTDNAPITNSCLLATTTDSTKTITQGQSYWGYTTSGIYKDTFVNSLGCDSIRTLNLTVIGFVTKRDTISKSICFGTSYLTYSNTGFFTDTFHLVSYDSIRTLNLKVLPAAVSTLDTIPASCGSVTYNGNVYLNNTLVTTTIKNYLGCDSIIQLHQIIVSQSKRDTFKVSICNGQSYLGYAVSGVYKLDSVRLASGCDSFSMVKLTVDKYIKDSINVTICNGDKYGSYQFAGVYYDTLKSITSCDTIRAINLSLRAKLNPKLLDDASICEKDSIVLNPGNFYSYLWNNNANTKTITAKSVGTYWVQVADSFGCKASDTFHLVAINPLPKGFLRNPYPACDGEQFTLSGFVSYNWSTGETTPTVSLTTLPVYSVKVTDINGCSGSDSMKVNYVGILNIQQINAFSPNGDDVNETFKPFSGSCITAYSMKIFDRWGQLLFETTNPNTGWNGKFKGSVLPTGVYYYIINYKNLLGVDNKKAGSITLLR